MPLTLNQIAANVASVSVPFGENSLNVEYYPALVTERTIAQLQGFSNGAKTSDGVLQAFSSLNDILSKLIKKWDFFENEAMTQMVPITPERLSELPISIRVRILSSIVRDISPEDLAAQSQSA